MSSREVHQPYLLLRARARPEARGRFEAWFRGAHLRDVRRIPGIVRVQSGTTPAGTRLGFYTFESSDVVQSTLASAEAAYARGTWAQWASDMEELSLEIFAPLYPMSLYESAS